MTPAKFLHFKAAHPEEGDVVVATDHIVAMFPVKLLRGDRTRITMSDGKEVTVAVPIQELVASLSGGT